MFNDHSAVKFDSNSFGFVKVAYVAGHGNFHIIPHAIDGLAAPKVKKSKKIQGNQAAFLTHMWREAGRKVGHYPRRTVHLDLS